MTSLVATMLAVTTSAAAGLADVGAASAPVAQAGTAATTAALASPSLLGAVFALLLVVALILALAWLLRRLPGSGFKPAAGLRVVASLAVGAKERIMVVEIGDAQLLIGVTAGGIRTLHALPEPLPVTAPTALPKLATSFAELLARRTGKGV